MPSQVFITASLAFCPSRYTRLCLHMYTHKFKYLTKKQHTVMPHLFFQATIQHIKGKQCAACLQNLMDQLIQGKSSQITQSKDNDSLSNAIRMLLGAQICWGACQQHKPHPLKYIFKSVFQFKTKISPKKMTEFREQFPNRFVQIFRMFSTNTSTSKIQLP